MKLSHILCAPRDVEFQKKISSHFRSLKVHVTRDPRLRTTEFYNTTNFALWTALETLLGMFVETIPATDLEISPGALTRDVANLQLFDNSIIVYWLLID